MHVEHIHVYTYEACTMLPVVGQSKESASVLTLCYIRKRTKSAKCQRPIVFYSVCMDDHVPILLFHIYSTLADNKKTAIVLD